MTRMSLACACAITCRYAEMITVGSVWCGSCWMSLMPALITPSLPRRRSESRSGQRLSVFAAESTPSVMESPRTATEPGA